MSIATFMLAASEETDFTKIIFGVVFFLIWAASAAMNYLAKKSKQQQAERLRQQAQASIPKPDMRRSAPPVRPQIQRKLQQRPVPPRPVQQRPVAAPRQVRRRAQPEPVAAPPPLPQPAPIAVAEIAAKPVAKRPTGATAESIKAWMRPATLRQQFILTEVLQPPKALRDSEL